MKRIKIRMLKVIRMLKTIGMLKLKIKNPGVRTVVGGLILWSAVVLGGGTLLYFIGRMLYLWLPSDLLEFLFLPLGFWGFLLLGLYFCSLLSLAGISFFGIVFVIPPILWEGIYQASVATGNFLFNNASPAQIE